MSNTRRRTRRDVDELLEDARRGSRPAGRGSRASRTGSRDRRAAWAGRGSRRRRRAVMLKPAPFSATKRSPLLISCTTPATTSPMVGAGDRRHGGDAHAGHLEAGRRRPRAVDGVDDEDELRVGRALQAAVLRVEGPGRQLLAPCTPSSSVSACSSMLEGDVAADGDAGVVARGVRAERGQHDLAQAAAEVDESVGRCRSRGAHSTLLYSGCRPAPPLRARRPPSR